MNAQTYQRLASLLSDGNHLVELSAWEGSFSCRIVTTGGEVLTDRVKAPSLSEAVDWALIDAGIA